MRRESIRVGVVDDEDDAIARLQRDFVEYRDEVGIDGHVERNPRLDSVAAITESRLAMMCNLDVILVDDRLPASGSSSRKQPHAVAFALRVAEYRRRAARKVPLLILCSNDPHPNVARSFCAFGGAHVVDKNRRREIIRTVDRAWQGDRWVPPTPSTNRLTNLGRMLLPLVERSPTPADIKLLCQFASPHFDAVSGNPSRHIEQELLHRYESEIVSSDFNRRDRPGGIRHRARDLVIRRAAREGRVRLPLEQVLELAAADGYSWVPYDDLSQAMKIEVAPDPRIGLW